MVCDKGVKDRVGKMVCDKVVCQRWCVTKWCDKVVCERWCVAKWCVKVGCEPWCVKDGVRQSCVSKMVLF